LIIYKTLLFIIFANILTYVFVLKDIPVPVVAEVKGIVCVVYFFMFKFMQLLLQHSFSLHHLHVSIAELCRAYDNAVDFCLSCSQSVACWYYSRRAQQ